MHPTAGCGNVAKVFVSYSRVQVLTESQMGFTTLPQVFRQKDQVAAVAALWAADTQNTLGTPASPRY